MKKRLKKHKRELHVNNAVVTGTGSSSQVRGYDNRVEPNINPYYNPNYYDRWRVYTKLYNTCWEIKKIVDIPIDDAFRTSHKISGLSEDVLCEIEKVYNKYNIVEKLKRSLKQERLYGGSVILPIIRTNDSLDSTFDITKMDCGDLLGFNVINVSNITRVDPDNNPFMPGYDRCEGLRIGGVEVDISRLIVFDGDPVVGFQNQMLMNYNINPCGFGESKITTIYDLLIHSVGTQEAAYHLVNLSSVLLLQVENLRSLTATGSPALEKLNEIVEQLSIYRGAVIDGKNTSVTQHSASFGAVPELIMTFCQLLSAASDIPATRFLGQAPGGLNATGESDTRNYYDMVDSIRNTKIKNAETRIINLIGVSLYGYEEWRRLSVDMKIEYESLWSINAIEQADIDSKYMSILENLYKDEVITKEELLDTLNKRGIYENQQ